MPELMRKQKREAGERDMAEPCATPLGAAPIARVAREASPVGMAAIDGV